MCITVLLTSVCTVARWLHCMASVCVCVVIVVNILVCVRVFCLIFYIYIFLFDHFIRIVSQTNTQLLKRSKTDG